MAGQTLLWDSRIRTIAVMLPALGAMTWVASEVASENRVIPLVSLGAFFVIVAFTVLIKTIRFESALLCLLVVGYLLGNRGFAELTFHKPLYPGEFALSVIVGCILIRFAVTRELPDLSGWVARVIFIFCAFGAVRLLMDYREYKTDAMRDSAMVYYSLYFFFGRQVASRPESKLVFSRCMLVAFFLLVVVAVIERFAGDLMYSTGFPMFFQKDDLLTTFASVGILVLYTNPFETWFFRRLRRGAILFFIGFIVSGGGRASVVALIVGCIPLLIAGKKKFLLYPAFLAVASLITLGAFALYDGAAFRSSRLSFLSEKMTSIVDFNSSHNYRSAYGENKADTNEFRRRLWESFVDDTNAHSPVFGRGFGYDFISHFEATFQKGGWVGLRSAHNFYVTLYGRMGLIGLALFLIITVQIFMGGISAALGVRAGLVPLADLGYWCGVWAILMSASVGVVLESPVGAIVFWVFLGVAFEASKHAVSAQKAAASSRFARREPLRDNSLRRPLNYG